MPARLKKRMLAQQDTLKIAKAAPKMAGLYLEMRCRARKGNCTNQAIRPRIGWIIGAGSTKQRFLHVYLHLHIQTNRKVDEKLEKIIPKNDFLCICRKCIRIG